MEITFPNESAEYREARRALLQREIALRREMESVAERRAFTPARRESARGLRVRWPRRQRQPQEIRLSALFRENTDTLFLYHFMFPRHKDDDRPKPTTGPMAALPSEAGPCPSCTAFLDQLDGAIPHVEAAGANFAAVAKAPLARVIAFARDHGWRNLRLLSAANNRFKRDYHGEDEQGQQVPMLTVFHRSGDGIRMSWASEMFYAPTDPGQDPRHNGTLEPLWTLFDLTPDGRPDFTEQIEYRHGQV